ncbi:MAG: methyltransferase domain-containing protein [Alphaproteobacteria bacterium]|nr:methyltransferase domain-containing protein [Alphaproteobacteria bacterium]
MNISAPIFDRDLVRRHIVRAEAGFARHDVLFRETETEIRERIADVKRDFPRALDLSPFPFLENAERAPDEETLSVELESFDLVVSNLSLHWVNDVAGALVRIRAALKSDGLFLAALIGGESLRELRACLMDAELSVSGGVSPRLSPTIDLTGAGALMRHAGFALPVVDKERVMLRYPDMFALMRDLRGTGQTAAHLERPRRFTRRAVFFEAARLYRERFGDSEGRIPATFDIIYLHGWKQAAIVS